MVKTRKLERIKEYLYVFNLGIDIYKSKFDSI